MKNCRTKYVLTYRVTGWIGLIVSVALLFIAWRANSNIATAIVSVFILLSIYCVIEANGTLEITPEMIIEHKLYGRYGIRWDEIQSIRYSDNGDLVTVQSMVLQGDDKRLAIPGPGDWAGAGAAEARRWFYEEIRSRGIEIKQAWPAGFKFSKNARLP